MNTSDDEDSPLGLHKSNEERLDNDTAHVLVDDIKSILKKTEKEVFRDFNILSGFIATHKNIVNVCFLTVESILHFSDQAVGLSVENRGSNMYLLVLYAILLFDILKSKQVFDSRYWDMVVLELTVYALAVPAIISFSMTTYVCGIRKDGPFLPCSVGSTRESCDVPDVDKYIKVLRSCPKDTYGVNNAMTILYITIVYVYHILRLCIFVILFHVYTHERVNFTKKNNKGILIKRLIRQTPLFLTTIMWLYEKYYYDTLYAVFSLCYQYFLVLLALMRISRYMAGNGKSSSMTTYAKQHAAAVCLFMVVDIVSNTIRMTNVCLSASYIYDVCVNSPNTKGTFNQCPMVNGEGPIGFSFLLCPEFSGLSAVKYGFFYLFQLTRFGITMFDMLWTLMSNDDDI